MERRDVPTRVGPVSVRVSGEGPAVLAVHGLLLDGRLWDPMARLLPTDVTLVVPDLPLGAHRVAVPDRSMLTPAHVAGALVDILDGLGIDRAVLVGNDTGGALVQIAASAHPDRTAGLVLAGCDAFGNFPPPLLRPFVAASYLPGGTALVVRALGVPALLAEPGPLNLLSAVGFGRDLTRDLLRPALTDRAVRADLTAFMRGVRPQVLLDAVPGLHAYRGRGAVVWGTRDVAFPAKDARRLADLLGTTVTWLEGGRTFLPLDRPAGVADAVSSLLADLQGSDRHVAESTPTDVTRS